MGFRLLGQTKSHRLLLCAVASPSVTLSTLIFSSCVEQSVVEKLILFTPQVKMEHLVRGCPVFTSPWSFWDMTIWSRGDLLETTMSVLR